MKTSYMNLHKILDIKKWQGLQDSLSLVTKLAIITVDYKGVPITIHSSPRPFCAYVRSKPELEKYCHKCDSRGGLEGVRINSPYIYLCHCKIVDIAIPIIIDGQYIGAIMAGQVRLADGEQNTQLEQILLSPAKEAFDRLELKQMYSEIPVLPYSQIQAVAGMLFDLCHYVVEEAMNKNLILEIYERMLPTKQDDSPTLMTSGYSPSSVEYLKAQLGKIATNAYLNTPADSRLVCKNNLLQPALNYIHANKRENIPQTKMADLCHISAGHFSRLFAKETGESFSIFIARQKVEWSKQLLEKTELSISEISDELGFSEPGYFIKIFKKYESITPTAYRRYYKNTSE